MRSELIHLLERYHDGEVSPAEAAEVESLLEQDTSAVAYLANLDEMSSVYRDVVDEQLSGVSFDGLWERVQAELEPAPALAPAPSPGFAARLGAMMSSVFGAHKGAWIAAGAAACAVALIMSQFGTTERVIERQIIVVESVDQLDQNNLVLVNSLKDDNTAVIWTLPNVNSQEQAPAEESQDDDDVVIVDEPL